MKTYQRIRGPVQEERCTNKSTWGSPLYCECGCQTPQDSDPDINLEGVTVTSKSPMGYADYILSRNGVECGSLNTQYSYIRIDGHEFLHVDRAFLQPLMGVAWSLPSEDSSTSSGDTLEETAAQVVTAERIAVAEQDERTRRHPGYCTKCHSYCYGDCEAND